MILVASQRGGARDLGIHLLKPENEHVTVHEISGFVADDVPGALKEVQAIAKGTRCKQYLFSCSLNPPPGEKVSTEAFEGAITRLAERLGLENQPRAVVFHEKEGRRHCHAVFSRIDTDQMKAVQLPFFKRKLMELSRELYIENGWKMPPGMVTSQERDLRNFSLAEWQQAKRAKKDVREIKAALQDSWAISDSKAAFAAALDERGYKLARGDRRGFVAVDHKGEVYAIAKWVGLRTSAVKARLGDDSDLPSVADRNREFASQIADRLSALKQEECDGFASQRAAFETERLRLVARQKAERLSLTQMQNIRWQQEASARQARYTRGLRGVVDRLSGRHRRIAESNHTRTYLARLRDRKEADNLIFKHVEERQALQAKVLARTEQYKAARRVLRIDAAHQQRLAATAPDSPSNLKRIRTQRRDRGLSL